MISNEKQRTRLFSGVADLNSVTVREVWRRGEGWGGVGRWGLLHYLIRQRGVRTEIVSHI